MLAHGLHISRSFRILLVIGALVLVDSLCGYVGKARIQSETKYRLAVIKKTWVRRSHVREIGVGLNRMDEPAQTRGRNPEKLTKGDFDEDGTQDLVAGYSGGNDGLLVFYRGNVDSIYPNTTEARQRRHSGDYVDAPFLSQAKVVLLPGRLDFLGPGDFDNDGHLDLVSGSRGGNTLYFMLGDGHGRFAPGRRVKLPGGLTSLITGEINRPDGIADLVVGVAAEQGSRVLVFESPQGVLQAQPEIYAVPFPANALALGQLGGRFTFDLAIASGNHLMVVHGRDRKLSFDQAQRSQVEPGSIEDRAFALNIESIAIGRFGGHPHSELSLLLTDGSVQTLSPVGVKNTLRMSTPDELSSPQVQQKIIHWQRREVFCFPLGEQPGQAFLMNGGSLTASFDNLIVGQVGKSKVHILGLPDEHRFSSSFKSVTGSNDDPTSEAVAMEVEGELADVTPLRLNGDAINDLVIFKSGAHQLTASMSQPESLFTVTNTNDTGPGSLRQAIIDANNTSGVDTITFNIPGSGVHTISPSFPLPDIIEPLTIDGMSQPGFAGIPLIEIEGSQAGDANGLFLAAGNCTIRGLTINRFFELRGVNNGYQIRIDITSSHNRIEGNLINTNNQGTGPAPNPDDLLFSGIFTQNSPDNTIGGTTPAARNVISGTKQIALELNGVGTTRTVVQGNFIGTDVTGTVAVNNNFLAILLVGPSNLIGGSVPGSRNVIANNASHAIRLTSELDGNVIQGNYIGTDVTGTIAMPDSGSGIQLGPASNTTVGGPSPNARNVISGPSPYGIDINASGRKGFLVQRNYIGTDASGAVALGHHEAGINLGNTRDSLFADNLISGNLGHGIHLFGNSASANQGTLLRNNRIGTDASGVAPLGNGKVGIYIDGTGGTLVGGVDGSGGNTIAFNNHGGVYVGLASENAIRQNSIFGNGGLGIDLAPLGCNYNLGCRGTVVPNDSCDSDNGGNHLQNFPVVSAAGAANSGSGIVVQGTLNSLANQSYVLDFFANDNCDSSGFGEGQTFLGSTSVNTGSSCDTSFHVLFPMNVPNGKAITATATDPAGNTSAFSECLPVAGVLPTPIPTPTPTAPVLQFSASSYSVDEAAGAAIVTVTRSGDTLATSTVDYATTDGSGTNNCNVNNGAASSRCDYLSTIGTLQFAANETSRTISIPIVDDAYAEVSQSFTITLSNPSNATLSPTTATIAITDNDATNGTNPIEVSSFFVRQHYIDFLNREPDTSGLAFWTGEIQNCAPKPQCTEVKRINVSAAFFVSIEFQQTGYLVYRLYKASYNNLTGTPVPLMLNEFLPDTQQIGQGVVVGAGNWQTQLENNKVVFTQDFVSRSRFTTVYPTTLTPAQLVDALFVNTGVTPSDSDRNAAINEFDGAGNTVDTSARARALRRVAENSAFVHQEFNHAFVLMQYFGYLRRNPNDGPEPGLNFDGYNFWLGKLNQFNGNYIEAEMVKAFITSGEYRQRFGQ